VSGHSLGGALADVFTLKDAARFRALRPEGLTIVSMASSGIPEDLPQHLNGIDADAATIADGVITSLQRPADYAAIVNGEDRVHFPNDFDGVPEADGLAPIFPLTGNLQFGGDIVFDVPNIENGDVLYYDPLDHPFDYRGMGAEHNSALLWTNLQGLMSDGLFSNYAGQHLIAGITDYNAVADVDGTAIALFEGYLELNNPNFINDRGYRSLIGTAGADYILGLAGADRLDGRTGFDLLSGGLGDDVILGGKGGDKILGGLGRDDLSGGEGRDRFVFREILESAVGNARDFIRDFNTQEGDRINLTGIDAKASTTGDDAFTFIGEAAFTGEGQIRTIQSGSDTIIRLNMSSVGGADMDILVRNFTAATFGAEDFIL
jgi:Ca2+-binding RTX toxin-like protein